MRKLSYNKKFFIPVKDASFCSELAAKIYQQANISILNELSPEYVKPSNFEKEADREDKWINITVETKEIFEKFTDDPNYKIVELCQQRIYSLIDMRREMDKILEQVFMDEKSTIISKNLREEYKQIKQGVANKVNIPYWDDTFKKEE